MNISMISSLDAQLEEIIIERNQFERENIKLKALVKSLKKELRDEQRRNKGIPKDN